MKQLNMTTRARDVGATAQRLEGVGLHSTQKKHVHAAQENVQMLKRREVMHAGGNTSWGHHHCP